MRKKWGNIQFDAHETTHIMGEMENEKDENDNFKAGVSIIINSNTIPTVKGIYKISGGIMGIKLKTGKSTNSISVLNAYAPRKWYSNEVNKNYRGLVKARIALIPTRIIRVWCTENSGELSRNDENRGNAGNWAIARNLENDNSRKLDI